MPAFNLELDNPAKCQHQSSNPEPLFTPIGLNNPNPNPNQEVHIQGRSVLRTTNAASPTLAGWSVVASASGEFEGLGFQDQVLWFRVSVGCGV